MPRACDTGVVLCGRPPIAIAAIGGAPAFGGLNAPPPPPPPSSFDSRSYRSLRADGGASGGALSGAFRRPLGRKRGTAPCAPPRRTGRYAYGKPHYGRGSLASYNRRLHTTYPNGNVKS